MPQEPRSSPRTVLAAVCLAQFMVPFMLTAVGVALPALGRDLGATALQLGMVEQLYALALAASILFFGRLGDVAGRGRVFVWGAGLFTLFTGALALAPGMVPLIAQRFAQGLSAAMLLSCSMALVAAAFPAGERGRAIGVVSTFTYSGLTLGLILGGAITSSLGWRAVFVAALPLGLSCLVLGLAHARRDRGAGSGERLDWTGSAAYATGVALLMLGTLRLGEVPVLGLGMMLAGLAVLARFWAMQSRAASPLLDVRLFSSSRFFTLSCLAAMGVYAATFGVSFFMSLYLQTVQGLSPYQAGLALLAQALAQVLVSPLAGRAADRMEPARLASAGMILASAGMILAAFCTRPGTPLALVCAQLALIGLGVGIFITPNTAAIMGSVAPHQFGVASGLIGAVRTLGMAVSMTVAALAFSLLMHGRPVSPATQDEFMLCLRVCLGVYAVCACAGLAASLGRGRRGAAQGASRNP